jgi:hypothetical protein
VKKKFVVAVKDTSSMRIDDGHLVGDIRPGKKLGEYRKQEFADRDFFKLANREGLASWHIGIFFDGKLIAH